MKTDETLGGEAQQASTVDFRAAAERHGITLTSDRLKELAAQAGIYADRGYYDSSVLITTLDAREGQTGIIADMHFPTPPSTQSKTEVVHRSIQSLQDYILLVEAGVIARPDSFLGSTSNEALIRILPRLGFAQHQHPQRPSHTESTASYDVVAERLFAPEIMRYDEELAKRLKAETSWRRRLKVYLRRLRS